MRNIGRVSAWWKTVLSANLFLLCHPWVVDGGNVISWLPCGAGPSGDEGDLFLWKPMALIELWLIKAKRSLTPSWNFGSVKFRPNCHPEAVLIQPQGRKSYGYPGPSFPSAANKSSGLANRMKGKVSNKLTEQGFGGFNKHHDRNLANNPHTPP